MINLDEQLKNVRTAAIAGHVRPDGDAFGSCMGMYLFLRTYYPQIDAHVYLEGNFSDAFRFVAHTDEIITSYPDCSYRSMSRLLTGLEALCRISMRQSARL